jgi:DNA mismatch repair protein MutH
MITRVLAVQNLQKYIGEELSVYAKKHGVTIFKHGKQNKGWKGQVLNILSGVGIDNKQAPMELVLN